jgi:hypothetical protein
LLTNINTNFLKLDGTNTMTGPIITNSIIGGNLITLNTTSTNSTSTISFKNNLPIFGYLGLGCSANTNYASNLFLETTYDIMINSGGYSTTPKMLIKSNGNIGIGTTDTGENILQIGNGGRLKIGNGNGINSFTMIGTQDNDAYEYTWQSINTKIMLNSISSSFQPGSIIYNAPPSGRHIFYTGGAWSLIIDSDGTVKSGNDITIFDRSGNLYNNGVSIDTKYATKDTDIINTSNYTFNISNILTTIDATNLLNTSNYASNISNILLSAIGTGTNINSSNYASNISNVIITNTSNYASNISNVLLINYNLLNTNTSNYASNISNVIITNTSNYASNISNVIITNTSNYASNISNVIITNTSNYASNISNVIITNTSNYASNISNVIITNTSNYASNISNILLSAIGTGTNINSSNYASNISNILLSAIGTGTNINSSNYASNISNVIITNINTNYLQKTGGSITGDLTIDSPNKIILSSINIAIPEINSGGTGARIILLPAATSALYPYSIGASNNTMWFSVPIGAQFNWYVGNSLMMNLATNGQLTVTNDIIGFGSFSDKRLKMNITNLSINCIHLLNKIKSVEFNWISHKSVPEKKHYTLDHGFIAQDIEELLPNLVNSEGEYKSLKYEKFAPYLVKAIQELHTLINDQQNQINLIKSHLNL